MLRNLSKNAKLTISILFAFMGLCLICYTYFDTIKDNLFSEKNINMIEEVVEFDEDQGQELSLVEIERDEEVDAGNGRYDYVGYLTISSLGIERGFTKIGNPYNSVKYNIQVIQGSSMPIDKNGNLILAAHSGTSSIGYFNKLHYLELGAEAKITYGNKIYNYKLVNIYEVEKDGTVEINRDASKNTLTLITCTYESNTKQTVYIFELDSVEKN